MKNDSHESLRKHITPSYTENSEHIFYKLNKWASEIKTALDKESLAQHTISYDWESQDIVVKR